MLRRESKNKVKGELKTEFYRDICMFSVNFLHWILSSFFLSVFNTFLCPADCASLDSGLEWPFENSALNVMPSISCKVDTEAYVGQETISIYNLFIPDIFKFILRAYAPTTNSKCTLANY